jgi:hypothetical protein
VITGFAGNVPAQNRASRVRIEWRKRGLFANMDGNSGD